MRRLAALLLAAALAPGLAAAQGCGGDFSGFVRSLAAEARQRGHDPATVERFFAGVRQDPAVLRADRAQGVFQLPFIDFARRLISQNRLQAGARMSQRHDGLLRAIERDLGVNRGILLAFWAFETDFGQVQGDFNTLNALVTLAHDCRRPELFRPQVFAALALHERGGFDPARTKGAWAGEIGMVQALPTEILRNGTDGDGDGRVDISGSIPDALYTGARVLRSLGWGPNEPWLQEVDVPSNLDWRLSGLESSRPAAEWARMGVTPRWGSLPGNLPASLLLPMGRNGPAFLAYPNFSVLFEWNKSFVYVTTAAYFATRLEGAPVFDAGNPAAPLSGGEMQALQQKLRTRGHDVGAIDGILGEKTRAAVQREQARLGLPADAWPTRELLGAL